ncbi:MAG TPA: 30S ribosomal protein S12 methylthiotransferase RimO [Kiritimatiellia bacterium]|nr:30S ribosomal protein S12 methylthiotransferase RimO [Kiritimatiellia bacterium]HMP34091.1 30S ribosomal protein S12 methylthiotransferase RimO [Kiritimatiellia bacterium]
MSAKKPSRSAATVTDEPRPPVVSLISLGCAKNEVDSERILGKLITSGFLVAEDPAEADVCLVNTCGFITDSREESAGVLRELQELKQSGRVKSVVALGCLVERASGAPETSGYLKDADALVGFQDYPKLEEICRELAAGTTKPKPAAEGIPVVIGDKRFKGLAAGAGSFTASYNQFLTAPRLRLGSPHIAHLKISEGCSNFCKFCSIPYIRGVQVSRPVEDIVREARELIDGGAVEISLIAQDTTSYGRDLYGEYRLSALMKALFALDAPVWFRLMYAFPRFLTDDMLATLASDPRLCPYIDMPLQHISDRMLSDMGRGMLRKETVALLDRIRATWPDGAIRTTFIVGYPGETAEQFDELLAFVQEGRFSHVGVFMYSHEPKTPSARLPDNVPLVEKKRRRDAIMAAQLEVSRKRLAAMVGRTVDVMVDGAPGPGMSVPRGVTAMGRSQREASDVDGVIFLKGRAAARLEPGTIIPAVIENSLDYDLIARPA